MSLQYKNVTHTYVVFLACLTLKHRNMCLCVHVCVSLRSHNIKPNSHKLFES